MLHGDKSTKQEKGKTELSSWLKRVLLVYKHNEENFKFIWPTQYTDKMQLHVPTLGKGKKSH